jgi:WS/DGAT/MGAT family acyltransferase
MHRLLGEDAAWLDEELPFLPLNPVVLAVLKPAEAPDGTTSPITMDYLYEHMSRRLGELPSLRWRIARVPLGLHHPVYIEDPDFDLRFHLHHAVLPAPAGDRELDRLVASVAERHLDRRHPLWNMTLVDGLDDGRQAVVYTYHHCLADGTAAITTWSRIFSGLDHEVVAPAEPWLPDLVPSKSRLFLDAARDYGRAVPRFPALAARTVRAFRAVRAHRRQVAVKAARPFRDTPVCSLNNSYVAERVVTRAALPLSEIKAVKSAAGVTLNDVALAVVAGAFRRYMLVRNELPEKALTATIPVALDRPDAPPRQSGNRFTGLTASLATDVEDPWARLRTIGELTDAAKAELDVFGRELMSEWAEFFPPFLHEAATRYVHRRRRKFPNKPDLVNVVVSNLRGPQERWSFGSALVEEMFVAGPPNAGIGPDVVLWSYADQLVFTILSFADSMLDPVAMGDYLRESLQELVRAAESHRSQAEAA